MAVAVQDRKRATSALKSWTDEVAAYERAFKDWESRVEKILKRYRDKRGANATSAKFNILWSNVQTLVPATFARVPKPDASRRFRDNDPIGRIAALLLERALEFEIQHYPTYRSTLRADVYDRFLGGRGTCWVRYEPHTRPMEDGLQVTEDAEDPPEEIDYECTPVDYVHWRDFGHSVARTWEEVTRVWRRVYMSRAALIKRFGKELGGSIPLDELPEDMKKQEQFKGVKELACVYEGWDRENRTVVWFNKSVKDFLDERAVTDEPDSPPLLEGFFPCPQPLYATITNESLEPVPDFTLYQDQANELDVLADRIDGLIRALKVVGVYDASQGVALSRLFTEAVNGTLIPVNNWSAFAEKNGLKGSIDIVDLDPIGRALKEAYTAFAQVIQFIYEITGISDIVRGQSDPNETLGAQQIKQNFVGLRLGDMRTGVALFATDVLRIMAEVICTKYQPQTILAYASADQIQVSVTDVVAAGVPMEQAAVMPPEQQKQVVFDAALALLRDKPLRKFRIDIAADSLIQLDEQQLVENRLKFITNVSGYLEKVMVSLTQVDPRVAAIVGPLAMDLLKFGVSAMKAGKTVEGAIDDAAEKLRMLAQQPPPPPQPDPKVEGQKQLTQMKIEGQERTQQLKERGMALEAQMDERKMVREEQHDVMEFSLDEQRLQQKGRELAMEVQAAHAMPKKPTGPGNGSVQ